MPIAMRDTAQLIAALLIVKNVKIIELNKNNFIITLFFDKSFVLLKTHTLQKVFSSKKFQ